MAKVSEDGWWMVQTTVLPRWVKSKYWTDDQGLILYYRQNPIKNETFQHHNKSFGGESVKTGRWLVAEEDSWIRQHLCIIKKSCLTLPTLY